MMYRGASRGAPRGTYRGAYRGQARAFGPIPRFGQERSTDEGELRSKKLDSLLSKVILGKWDLGNISDAERMIEAVCNQSDKSDCVERLASSTSGQKALHKALTLDISPKFINTWASQLLEYLSDPMLKRLCDGEVLNQVLQVIVEPPRFWHAILEHVKDKSLNAKAVEGFAWLLLQMVILPVAQSGPFRTEAQSLLTPYFVEQSPSLLSKSSFQKIRSLVSGSSMSSNDIILAEHGPGGRHDNDFVNYRDISILPTKAELDSSELPFIRQASELMQEAAEGRAILHLDNQYRLLREDMLEEMRDDLKFAKDTKRQNKRNMLIEGLSLKDIDTDALKKVRPCGLVLQCSSDILNMSGAGVAKRKKALRDMPSFLKHNSIGCILLGGAPLAFAILNRNEDLLSLEMPCICLLVKNKESLRAVLCALQHDAVDFLQVPTALFAYEPILNRLQKKLDVELDDDILAFSETFRRSPFTPDTVVESLNRVRLRPQTDLQDLLDTNVALKLDKSQIEALLMALSYQVAAIQGPPGSFSFDHARIMSPLMRYHRHRQIFCWGFANSPFAAQNGREDTCSRVH
jgi:hypothetical protein